ncbi:MAG: N-acetyl-gamma-glutamyl-phosphate reductase [Alphaproteobacteria bacterium]|nr:N-acetyl-gamma-glutamyl-phosphate reductase [Alphaproteobacteria bacterium]
MSARVFIDGAAGTTGLEIRERLAGRTDLEIIHLSDSERKEASARKAALNEADLVILCLPDEAAKESVSMIENDSVRVLDASSAHRVALGWTYGFAEMEPDQRAKIAASNRVSNPGCYPTGMLALVRPLTRAGLLPADYPLSVFGISGYSGGGKSMIEEFEKKDSPAYVDTVARTYGLTLAHKHVPEMQVFAKLTHAPVFSPNVARYYRGMIVEVPLQLWALPTKPTVLEVQKCLQEAYLGEKLVQVAGLHEAANLKTLDAEGLKLTNGVKLFVFGNDKTQQVRLVAVLDNLGKGASGAAVQNLNIMLGLPETEGLL